MKEYEVCISDNAVADLDVIYQDIYDLTKSATISKKQCEILMDAINFLKQFPDRIKKLSVCKLDGQDIHCMPVGKFSVLFIKNADDVFVLNILYGSGDIIQKLLTSN